MNNSQTLYNTDYCQWLETTIALLRLGEINKVDLENLIEELEGMSNSQKDALESNLRILLMHLLKWKFQPEKRTNSWKFTIAEHALRINKALKKSPSLSRYFDEVLEECYQDSVLLASLETGLPKSTFPVDCPFSRVEILDPETKPE